MQNRYAIVGLVLALSLVTGCVNTNTASPLTTNPQEDFERQVTASAFRSLYLATDHRLNRKVSFRVSESEPAALRDWFLREAEALARLDHPAIRPLYDVGEGGGLVWRIGNWLEG